jgi:hypothetical protein
LVLNLVYEILGHIHGLVLLFLTTNVTIRSRHRQITPLQKEALVDLTLIKGLSFQCLLTLQTILLAPELLGNTINLCTAKLFQKLYDLTCLAK